MELEHQLNIQLEKSSQGKKVWMNIIDQFQLQKQDYVIVFPSLDSKMNYLCLLYAGQFVESKQPNKVYIITSNRTIEKAYHYFATNLAGCHVISPSEMDELLHFYKLYLFTDRLIIAAFDELPGRTLKNLAGINDISLEELISVGIYQLRKFRREDTVTYSGKDADVIQFFECIEQAT